MSPNGRILSKILERHALIVANGSERCQGLVTRERTTMQRTEKSCIDILVFSSDLNKHFKSLIVDEKRKHVLTRITKTKKGVTKKESYHNVLITEFTCNVSQSKKNNKI